MATSLPEQLAGLATIPETGPEMPIRKQGFSKTEWRKKNQQRIKEYNRTWFLRAYAKQRDVFRARSKRYKDQNKEKVKAQEIAYRAKNKERVAKRKHDYNVRNREAIRVQTADYRFRNRARTAAVKKKYNRNNSSKVINWTTLRRARQKKALIGNQATIVKWRKAISLRVRVNCYWCGSIMSGKEVHADHINALSRGGPHSIDNLCVSCPDCNLRKTTRSLQEWNSVIRQPVLL